MKNKVFFLSFVLAMLATNILAQALTTEQKLIEEMSKRLGIVETDRNTLMGQVNDLLKRTENDTLAIQLRENLQAEYAKIRAEFITDRLAEDKALALAFGGDEAVAINYANEKDAVKKANLLVGIINEYMATKNTNTTDPRVDEALKIAKSAKVVADLADTKSQTAMSKATTALVVADTTKITLASEVDDRVNFVLKNLTAMVEMEVSDPFDQTGVRKIKVWRSVKLTTPQTDIKNQKKETETPERLASALKNK